LPAVNRRNVFRAAQWIFAALVLFFAGRALIAQWDMASARLVHVSVSWGRIALASLVVLITYALLIEGWRQVLVAWGGHLSYMEAARIWCLSNLGKYVPGNVWSLTAMGVMSRDRGISAIAATGSSIIMQLLTLSIGLGVVLVTGAKLIGNPMALGILLVILLALIAAAPRILPPLTRLLASFTGWKIPELTIPAKVVWGATLAGGITWLLYGFAFRLFTEGLLGSASGATMSYIAVYTAAYILGFISPIAPAGLGVREVALAAGMTRFGLASEGDAALVAIAARLWLTLLELIPSAGFVLAATLRRRSTSNEG
jgi:glycosyltransferase 2 family protein